LPKSDSDFLLINRNTDRQSKSTVSSIVSSTKNFSSLIAPDCPPATVTNPYIGGRIYRDVDHNGVFDNSIDQPVEAVLVSIYSPTGLVGTTTSSADGDYLFESAAMTNGTEYRVEFTDFPSFLEPGAVGNLNNTSVQFVSPSVCDISLGLVDPYEYIGPDPDVVLPCFIMGDNTGTTGDALVSFPFDATPGTTKNLEAQGGAIGTTYGVAYSQQSEQLFVSAYYRRFTGFPQAGKTGSIYLVTNPTDGAYSGTEFLDLNALFGSNVAGNDVHDFTPANTEAPDIVDFYDNASFNATGRTSFGDMEITPDGSMLWVVNLNDRSLYGIPLGSDPKNPVAPTNAGQIQVIDIIGNLTGVPSGVTTDELIPFALKYYQGSLYIGVVANGQTSPANAYDNSDMYGLIYRYDGSTFTKVLEFPLNYDRGNGIYANFAYSPQPADVNNDTYGLNWNPWLNANALPAPMGVPALTGIEFWDQGHPQPVFTDIEFDAAGNMIIGIRDRFGDQQGYQTLNVGGSITTDEQGNPPMNPSMFQQSGGHNFNSSFGDMLLATPNGSGWSVNIADFTDSTYDGPSGTTGVCPPGESFFGDDCYNGTDLTVHEEIFMGGLALDTRTNTVLSTCIDPIQNPFSNGIIRYNTTSGNRQSGFEVFETSTGGSGGFGKSAGLGDLEIVSSPAPIELGNRLWEDEDLDGIQDPGEPGINGVLVELFLETSPGNFTKVAETTTGTSGNQGDGAYLFSMSGAAGQTWVNGATAVEPLSNYQIRISLANVQAANSNITDFSQSNQNSDTSNDAATDLNDADQIVNAGVASISYTTEDGGFNNHTLDFGVIRCALIANAGSDQSLCAGSSATLTASATQGTEPYTYTWDNGLGGGASQTVSPTTTTTYTVTVTDDNGCTATDQVNVTVNALPTVTLNDPADVCIGGSDMNFTATPAGGIFSTTAPSGFTPNNAAGTAVLDVSAAGAGTYDVTYDYTDGNGCMASQTVSVTVNALPTVTLNDPADVCIDGSDMNFTATPAGGTFSTTAPSGFTPNNAAGTAILDVSTAGVGTYDVTYDYTDGNGCMASQTVSVTVNALPTIDISTVNVNCYDPNSGSIDITVSVGTGPFTYDWQDLPGTDDPEDRIGLGVGEYRVIVTDANNCASNEAVINIVSPTCVTTSSLGSTVFTDLDNDGIYEDGAGEMGIAQVVLNLDQVVGVSSGGIDLNNDGSVDASDDGFLLGYVVIDGGIDYNGDGVVDNNDDGTITSDDGVIYTVVDGALNGVGDGTLNIQVASTTTDANGNYFFDGLTPGDYQIEIPDSEFGAGEPLNVTSTSSIPTVTVDAGTSNIDNDDNGIQVGGSGTATVSPVVTLSTGQEPLNGGTEIGQGNDQDSAADADGDMTIDFGFFFLQMDYGDLADSDNGTGSGNYETQSANGGPSHIILPNIQLGASIDGESDGQQSPNADGDDNNGDDEDGVDLNGLNFQAGQTISIPIVVTNNTGSTANLYAFIDWNNDGDFGDTGEQVLVSVPSMAGTQTILVDFTIPTEVAGAAINTTVGARFRLTTDTLSGNAWEGAANNGEIEDYVLMINCPTGNCLPVQISNN
jgi:hypothetical protein